jgi:hypothetical protein
MTTTTEHVTNFMNAYSAKIDEAGLPEANAFADKLLHDMSKDMDDEAVHAFTQAVQQPLSQLLMETVNVAETAVQGLTDAVEELTEELETEEV